MRLLTNVSLLVLFVLCLANVLLSDLWHEIIGMVMLGAILWHIRLNAHALKPRLKSSFDKINSFLIWLMAVSFVSLFVSGTIASHELFEWLGFQEVKTAQKVHIGSAYWLAIFAGLHLGLHVNRLTKQLKKVSNFGLFIKNKALRIVSILGIFVAATVGFLEQNIHIKLMFKHSFSFFDFSGFGIFWFLLYLGTFFVSFVLIGQKIKTLCLQKK